MVYRRRLQLFTVCLVVFSVFLLHKGRLEAVGESLDPISVSSTATMENVGLDILLTGDTNGNATMTPQYRVGSGAWTTGQPCLRTILNHAACSLFGLTPSTTYSYQVLFSDPDGTSQSVLSGSAITRATTPIESFTRTYYVAPGGNDSADGLTQGTAFATIQHAVNVATNNTKILVAPGTYREAVSVTKNSITIESQSIATSPGATPATIDLSLPGLDTVDAIDNWAPDPGRSGGYYTDLTSYAPSDQVMAVYRDTERIYGYSYYPYNSTSNYTNYLNGIFCPDGGSTCFASGVTGGYFYDSNTKRLYLAIPDGTDPDLYPIHVVRRNSIGLQIYDGTNVVIRGLQAQYANSGFTVRTSASGYSNDNWIDQVVTKYSNIGVGAGETYGHGDHVFGTVVQDSRMSDTTAQQDWPWASIKLNDAESTGIVLAQGYGAIIQRNVIQNFFNGIDGTIAWALTDSAYNTNSDVAYNTVLNTGDDGIELDGPALNLRVYQNSIISNRDPQVSQSGISVAPITVGPAWLIRNTVVGIRQSSLKMSYAAVSSAGRLFVYHNTFVSSDSDLLAVVRNVQSNNQTGQTVTFRNNLLIAAGTEQTGPGAGYIFEDAAANHTNPPMVFNFDYDDFFSNRSCQASCPFASWLSVNYSSLATWAAASGQEAHGRSVDPLFTNPGTGDYTLRVGSPVIDQGVALAGINDGFNGSAPDLGALEYTVDVTPPAAVTDLLIQ